MVRHLTILALLLGLTRLASTILAQILAKSWRGGIERPGFVPESAILQVLQRLVKIWAGLMSVEQAALWALAVVIVGASLAWLWGRARPNAPADAPPSLADSPRLITLIRWSNWGLLILLLLMLAATWWYGAFYSHFA